MVNIFILFIFWFTVQIQTQFVHAPELIRGKAISCEAGFVRLGYIDGGDWQAVQIGVKSKNAESGIFLRVGGANIDNNNLPVAYTVDWKNEHKYSGDIYYRGHKRKLCAANLESNLPCR